MAESLTERSFANPALATLWQHDACQPELRAGVFFRGIVYGGSGYAEECWIQALGLEQNHIPVQLIPLQIQDDYHSILPAPIRELLSSLRRQRVDLSHSVLYQHAQPYLWDMNSYCRKRVGRTMFETDRVPDAWVERCNDLDELWVPSEFNRHTFSEAGVSADKLKVMHAGVDTRLFRPDSSPLDIQHRRHFNFLSVFDLEPRKGSNLLLQAYLTEFKPDEDVALILKISQHNDALIDPEAQLAYLVEKQFGLALERTPPIILLKGFLSQADIARLYAAADALVLPSHGEGYGRPFLEALACELPVIATRWSGQLDFLRDENSYLIDIEGVVPAATDLELFAGHFWAQPSVEHLRQLMREVFSHPEQAKKRAQQGRQDMVAEWDWSVVVPRWVNEFRRLLE